MGDKLIQPDRFSRNTYVYTFQIPSCKTSIRDESFYYKRLQHLTCLYDRWGKSWLIQETSACTLDFKSHIFIGICLKFMYSIIFSFLIYINFWTCYILKCIPNSERIVTQMTGSLSGRRRSGSMDSFHKKNSSKRDVVFF